MVVIRWLLVTAYVAFIFIFSQSTASSAGSMADWLLNMFPFLDNYDLGMVVLYLRKLIHIGGYFLAAVLFYAAAKVSPRLERFPAHTAFILAVLLAVCDESYQTRLTHRSGTVSDIFIDLVGISLGIISVKVYQNFKGRPKKASSS